MQELIKRSLLVGALAGLSACASHNYLKADGHRFFQRHEYDRAAEDFAKRAQEPGTNQVLFLLDQGSSLFAAGRYKEAVDVFLRAEELTEVKDYTSISEEVGVLATSSNVRGYKGEDFEKVLINVYLALSFVAMGEFESAQVEARKINLLLHRMIHEGKRNYEESPFARYLSALLWEATGEYNSAYIDYKKTYELDPEFPGIGSDLLAMARRMRFTDDVRKWSEKFPDEKARELASDQGELVLIFESGLSPIKTPRPEMQSLPRFVPRRSVVKGARLVVDGDLRAEAVEVLDIEGTSIRYLEDRIGRMKAAKVAGTLAKGAIGAGVAKLSDNNDLGTLVFYALLASDQADLRSWRTLPQSLDMIRIPLPAGEHHVAVEVLGSANQVLRKKDFGTVNIRPRSKVFLLGR